MCTRGAVIVGCSIVHTGSFEIGSRWRNFDEAARCETVVGDIYVVLARFAYHIGQLDFVRDTIKPPRLQLNEVVPVAFFGRRRYTVEQEVSVYRRAVRRSQVHGESAG